jgi:hypothetical protein
VELTLPFRITNLELFEGACVHCGIGAPPWRPEELAGAAEFEFDGLFKAADDDEKDLTSSSLSSLSNAFKVSLVVFLCRVFDYCRKLTLRTKSQRKTLRVQKKKVREVSAEVLKSRETAIRTTSSHESAENYRAEDSIAASNGDEHINASKSTGLDNDDFSHTNTQEVEPSQSVLFDTPCLTEDSFTQDETYIVTTEEVTPDPIIIAPEEDELPPNVIIDDSKEPSIEGDRKVLPESIMVPSQQDDNLNIYVDSAVKQATVDTEQPQEIVLEQMKMISPEPTITEEYPQDRMASAATIADIALTTPSTPSAQPGETTKMARQEERTPSPPKKEKSKQKAGLVDGSFRRKKKPTVGKAAVVTSSVSKTEDTFEAVDNNSPLSSSKLKAVEATETTSEANASISENSSSNPVVVDSVSTVVLEESSKEEKEKEIAPTSVQQIDTLSTNPDTTDTTKEIQPSTKPTSEKSLILVESQQPSLESINLDEIERNIKNQENDEGVVDRSEYVVESWGDNDHLMSQQHPVSVDFDQEDSNGKSDEENAEEDLFGDFSVCGGNGQMSALDNNGEKLAFEQKFIQYDDEGEDISEGVQFYQPVIISSVSAPLISDQQFSSGHIDLGSEVNLQNDLVGNDSEKDDDEMLNPEESVEFGMGSDRQMFRRKSEAFFVSWGDENKEGTNEILNEPHFKVAENVSHEECFPPPVEDYIRDEDDRSDEADHYNGNHQPEFQHESDMDEYDGADHDPAPNFSVDQVLDEDDEEEAHISIEADAKLLAEQQLKQQKCLQLGVPTSSKHKKTSKAVDAFDLDEDDEDDGSAEPPVVDVDELLKGTESDEEDMSFAREFMTSPLKPKGAQKKEQRVVHKKVSVSSKPQPKKQGKHKQQRHKMETISAGYFDDEDNEPNMEEVAAEEFEEEFYEDEESDEPEFSSQQTRKHMKQTGNTHARTTKRRAQNVASAAEPDYEMVNHWQASNANAIHSHPPQQHPYQQDRHSQSPAPSYPSPSRNSFYHQQSPVPNQFSRMSSYQDQHIPSDSKPPIPNLQSPGPHPSHHLYRSTGSIHHHHDVSTPTFQPTQNSYPQPIPSPHHFYLANQYPLPTAPSPHQLQQQQPTSQRQTPQPQIQMFTQPSPQPLPPMQHHFQPLQTPVSTKEPIQSQSHPVIKKPRPRTGFMTFPLPEKEIDEDDPNAFGGEDYVDPDTEAAWSRNQHKIIEVKRRLQKRKDSDKKLKKERVKAQPQITNAAPKTNSSSLVSLFQFRLANLF